MKDIKQLILIYDKSFRMKQKLITENLLLRKFLFQLLELKIDASQWKDTSMAVGVNNVFWK